MNSGEEFTLLVEALKERDISIPHQELRTALQSDSDSTIKAWIQEYIGQDTLLTKEELALYKSLKKSGEFTALEQSADLAATRPRDDAEIRAAIDDLKRQTASIEKQTEALKIQQDALASWVKKSQQQSQDREKVSNDQYRAWSAENASLSTQIDEQLRSLNYQIIEAGTQRSTADSQLQRRAAEVLQEDDKLLSDLQKLVDNLDPESPEEEQEAQRVRDLCARLIKHTVECVRIRLDRIYLESLTTSEAGNEVADEDDTQVAALQAELESLYSEILPVAQMSAEQQFLTPALQARSVKGEKAGKRVDAVLQYASQSLEVQIARLQAYTTHAEEYQSHRAANVHFIDAVNAEIASASPSSPVKAVDSSSPMRRKQPQSMSPVRSKNRRRSSYDDDIAPEHQLLRNLGLSLPDATEDPQIINDTLASVLADRKAKLSGHALNLRESEEVSIPAALQDSYLTLHQLRESLLGESKYNRPRFVDEEIDEAIALMEKEIEDLKLQAETVDVEKLRERNVLRDALIERWGR